MKAMWICIYLLRHDVNTALREVMLSACCYSSNLICSPQSLFLMF